MSNYKKFENPTQLPQQSKSFQTISPTAPSINDLDPVPGYDNLTLDPALIKPPVFEFPTGPPPDRQSINNFKGITEEEVRDAVINFVSQHCCYGKKPAQELKIKDIKMSSCFHYQLETYGEQRETHWSSSPYRVGDYVDGPANGPAPGPWDVPVMVPGLFVDNKAKAVVPHTASVKPCSECVGIGRIRCNHCFGRGQDNCGFCNGRGFNDYGERDSCLTCNGLGYRRCTWCNATGQTQCSRCSGYGHLKYEVVLKVKWTNHSEDYISQTTNLPKELIKGATGQTAFEEAQPLVWPIQHFPERAVNDASGVLVDKHSKAFPLERILQQRHKVRIVPVSMVEYSWKENHGQFCVYGFENNVYFPDYPQKCCLCTIL